jgi:hypothetical protein
MLARMSAGRRICAGTLGRTYVVRTVLFIDAMLTALLRASQDVQPMCVEPMGTGTFQAAM